MSFFYDLNKKLNGIRELPETTHKQLNESKPDFLDLDKDGDKKEPMKQAAKQKPDYKSKMQDKFGGSAADLTRGLSIKSKKVNEAGMSRAAKGIEKYGKDGMQALAKAGREGKALDPVRNKYDKYDESMEEGNYSKDAMELNPDFAKVGRKPGVIGKIAKGIKRVADFVAPGDEDLLRDLERKTGGRRPAKEAAAPMTPKQKSFAKLAPPADKITFADKIAGAKKEVDEMLGDVAAEAMKAALGKGKQPVRGMGEATKEIPGGRRHTAGPGGYGRKDDDDAPRVQTQRGRGRPKKNADSETGQVMKPDWSAFGVGKVNLPKHKGAVTKHKMVGEESDPQTWTTIEDVEFIQDLMDRAFEAGSNSLGNTLQGVLEKIKYNQDDEDDQVNEKAVSKKQQRFMGMVHAAKKGEKPASKEVARAAKGISAKEADKFASTKHKGLPEKAKEDTDTRDTKAEKAGKRVTKDIEYDEKSKDGDHGKKRGPQDAKAEKAGKKVAKDIEHDEKVDETTTSGSVATAPAAGGKKSSGGFNFGGGIYDSMNRDLENMIAESMTRLDESMNISMNMNSDSHGGPTKSLTITATEDDADKLAMMLKMAGMGGDHDHGQAYSQAPDMVDENKPDWPTDTETSDDAFQYSGGLNKPKRDVAGDGQATGQVTAVSSVDHDENEELDRMMEMAGVREGKQPDFPDNDKLDEGWKEKLGAAGLAGAMAMGSLGAGAAQAAPQQGLDSPTTATQQQTQSIWRPAYQRAVSLSDATKNPTLQQDLEDITQRYMQLSGLGDVKNWRNPDRKAQEQKELDLKFKGDLEQLLQRYNANESAENDEIRLMKERAGIRESKRPDFPDIDNDGDKKETISQAAKDKKEKEEKVDESIFASTANLWKTYKG
jgi:hypothetical protein